VKNIKKYGFLLLFISVFFSGCQKQEENLVIEKKVVKTEIIEKKTFSPTIEISGFLEPKSQTLIAAEISGTVSTIFVEEGTQIFSGQKLLQFSAGDNFAATDLQAARTALENAEKNLQIVISSSEFDKKSAEISIQKAKTAIESLQKSEEKTDKSVSAQVSAAESSIKLAETNLKNAEKNLQDIEETFSKSEQDLQENIENTVSSSIVSLRSALNAADEILGVSDSNEYKNDSFEYVLGFYEPQTRIDAENTFLPIWHKFLKLEKSWSDDPKKISISQIQDISKEIRDVLQKTDLMLQKTTSTGSLPDSAILGFKNSITTQRNQTEQILTQISQVLQQEKEIEIQKSQKISSAKIAVQSSKEQLEQAKKNVSQVDASGDNQKIQIDSQILQAEKDLQAAENQKASVLEKSDLSIQSAIAARDSARSALNSAQMRYGKLSVFSSVTGTLLEKKIEIGSTITAGSPLFLIGDINYLKFFSEVSTENINNIEVGMSVEILVDNLEQPTIGVITKIFPIADVTTRRVKIEVEVPNLEKKLFANSFARGKISGKAKEKIVIPFSALVSEFPPEIFVVENEMVVSRKIELGKRNSDFVEIISGLSVDDEIVIEKQPGLESGNEIYRFAEEENLDQEQEETEEKKNNSDNLEKNLHPASSKIDDWDVPG